MARGAFARRRTPLDPTVVYNRSTSKEQQHITILKYKKLLFYYCFFFFVHR